ncbi:MAG: RNA polymerase sigma factor [Anaerolineae bacterium]
MLNVPYAENSDVEQAPQPDDQSPAVDARPVLSADDFAAIQTGLDAPIRRFIRRTLGTYGDETSVEDLAQETFIALYRKLTADEKRIPIGDAKPYAFGIARNLCYEELRRVERYGLSLEADHDQAGGDGDMSAYGIGYVVAADPSIQPEEAAYWLLLNVEVQAAIDRLPEAQRQVLLLYCEQEMSYDEIARVMGTNIGTVKSRLHYAKRSLRGLLSAAALEAIEQEFS